MSRKNISITNKIVEKALDESENASKLIEKAILNYLELIKINYVTAEQVEEMINKKIEGINGTLELITIILSKKLG